jgi:hypothetical protein
MPYIKYEQRRLVDKEIDNLGNIIATNFGLSEQSGVVNYVFCRILDRLFNRPNYDTLGTATQVLHDVDSEWHDKVMRPYEDYKEKLNGSVFTPPTIPMES